MKGSSNQLLLRSTECSLVAKHRQQLGREGELGLCHPPTSMRGWYHSPTLAAFQVGGSSCKVRGYPPRLSQVPSKAANGQLVLSSETTTALRDPPNHPRPGGMLIRGIRESKTPRERTITIPQENTHTPTRPNHKAHHVFHRPS